MRVLVRDHIGHALEFRVSRGLPVNQEGVFTKRDRPQVLHGPGGEVRNGEQVQLVTRVRQAVIVLEKPERVGRDLQRESGEVAFPRYAPDPQRCAADLNRVRCLQVAHDEGDQVRGHADRVSEPQNLLSAFDPFRDDACIGNRGQAGIDHQGQGEHGLECRFVPTGEGPTSVCRFELGGSQDAWRAGLLPVGAPVKASKLVVEDALECEPQTPLAGPERFRESHPTTLC